MGHPSATPTAGAIAACLATPLKSCPPKSAPPHAAHPMGLLPACLRGSHRPRRQQVSTRTLCRPSSPSTTGGDVHPQPNFPSASTSPALLNSKIQCDRWLLGGQPFRKICCPRASSSGQFARPRPQPRLRLRYSKPPAPRAIIAAVPGSGIASNEESKPKKVPSIARSVVLMARSE